MKTSLVSIMVQPDDRRLDASRLEALTEDCRSFSISSGESLPFLDVQLPANAVEGADTRFHTHWLTQGSGRAVGAWALSGLVRRRSPVSGQEHVRSLGLLKSFDLDMEPMKLYLMEFSAPVRLGPGDILQVSLLFDCTTPIKAFPLGLDMHVTVEVPW